MQDQILSPFGIWQLKDRVQDLGTLCPLPGTGLQVFIAVTLHTYLVCSPAAATQYTLFYPLAMDYDIRKMTINLFSIHQKRRIFNQVNYINWGHSFYKLSLFSFLHLFLGKGQENT